MTPKQQRRLVFTIALLLGSALAIGLIVFALDENAHLYFTPTQVRANEVPDGATFRLGGMVKDGSFKRTEGELDVSFVLTDYEGEVTVTYNKILPDLFREGQGIIALGNLSSDGVFVAQEVLAKHDENYMPKEVADSLKNKDGKLPEKKY